MKLDWLHENCHWPNAASILSPAGAGPRIITRQAREKLGGALSQVAGGDEVACGILTPNPNSAATEAPVAIVCEFPRSVSEETLREAQWLAWNFSKSPTLITIQPHIIRMWSCCQPPKTSEDGWNPLAELLPLRLELDEGLSPSDQAVRSLEWVRLVNSDHVQMFPERFRLQGRADSTLLYQLNFVRKRLKRQELADGTILELDDDTIHDLLARVIFIQFLWDRKDGSGKAALNQSLLERLKHENILINLHSSLLSVLRDYHDTYELFRWLNGKFNGDLFPGKGRTEDEREAEWKSEMDKVKPEHLRDLASLVRGDMQRNQPSFWKLYSFDVIPLEVVSSIYEQFVKEKGADYTPDFLADFVLDAAISWDGIDWDLKVLDPACGSGVFLVKAYQRLIERWRNAHPGEKPTAGLLKQLLESNLFGVDKDEHAVRVASFSLYLTLCDQVDPKHYLETVKLPRMRGRRLIHADFFEEEKEGFRTESEAGAYDVVVGNAPWGRDLVTSDARDWAKKKGWPILNTDIGTLFLPKSLSLTKPGGVVSMIGPAGGLLFNTTSRARDFRRKFFSSYQIEEVVNLSALRFELFAGRSRSPACVITVRPEAPNGASFAYTCPKPSRTSEPRISERESIYQLAINSSDVNLITQDEAASDPLVWTTLFWGGRRDLSLIRKLGRLHNLDKLEREKSADPKRRDTWK